MTSARATSSTRTKFFQKSATTRRSSTSRPLGVDRGEPVGAYAIIKLKNGETSGDDELLEIERARVSRSRTAGLRNWWGNGAQSVLRLLQGCAELSGNRSLLARDDEDRGAPLSPRW